MGFEDMNPLSVNCPSCEQFGKVRLEGRWETAPGETCSYNAKLKYEREHGHGSVTAWPYFVCDACGCCWRGTKNADGESSTANLPLPHACPVPSE
ncbi:MAG: hypothetical protein ACRCYU_06535 [Nocardioides sp.]